jgi:hypothetical protein
MDAHAAFESAKPEVFDAERIEEVRITSEDIALVGVGSAGICMIVLVGGAVAGNAVLVSLMTVGSGSILWIKAPKTLGEIPGVKHAIKAMPISAERKERLLAWNWKEALLKHELLFDVLVSAAVFGLFGATLTGLVAAGLTGLSISVMLRGRKIVKKLLTHYGWDQPMAMA